MTTYDEAVAKAAEIGREHGENAAAWWLTTWPEEMREGRADAILSDGLYNACDPEMIPAPDLSGEWADGYTPRQLLHDCGGNDGDASFWDGLVSDLCDAYETAFSEAVEEAVTAACQQALAE